MIGTVSRVVVPIEHLRQPEFDLACPLIAHQSAQLFRARGALALSEFGAHLLDCVAPFVSADSDAVHHHPSNGDLTILSLAIASPNRLVLQWGDHQKGFYQLGLNI